MYESYFGLKERPFSIAPDPQYLFMSTRHKEAMAHLTYGLTQGGGFIVLTGEVGTGKTTLCRNLLAELPGNIDVALILNPDITEKELLKTICDELGIAYEKADSQNDLLSHINKDLLESFSKNRNTVLIIDEAQILKRDVLEQIRLLTNLETTKTKLLQIILIGQPELNETLRRNDLRQLTQRITARYHLDEIKRNDIQSYVNHRLSVAGCKKPLFSKQALNRIHTITDGIPRKINVLSDLSLLKAYSKNMLLVDSKTVSEAAKDVYADDTESLFNKMKWQPKWIAIGLGVLLMNLALWWWLADIKHEPTIEQATEVNQTQLKSQEKTASIAAPIIKNKVEADQTTEVKPPQPPLIEQIEPQSLPVVKNLPAAISKPNIKANSSKHIINSLVSEKPKVVVEPKPEPQRATSNVRTHLSPVTNNNFDSTRKVSALRDVLAVSADRTVRIDAFRTLAKLWNKPLPDVMLGSACDEIGHLGLSCLTIYTWRNAVAYNRPAIIVLNIDDSLHRVVLTKVHGNLATIQIGDNEYNVAINELAKYWGRKGVLFWQESKLGSKRYQIGNTNNNIVSLRIVLNKAMNRANLPLLNEVKNPNFDRDMREKVVDLQTKYNLINSGAVGSQTYILLNDLSNDGSEVMPTLYER